VRAPTVPGGQNPAVIGLAAVTHERDAVSKAFVPGCVYGAEVVEATEDVIVPARREVEANEGVISDLAGAVGAIEAMVEKEGTATRLRGGDLARGVTTPFTEIGKAFEGGDGGVEGAVGSATGSATVPPAVGHLNGKEVREDAVHPLILDSERCEH
jgi:hypothetical protein